MWRITRAHCVITLKYSMESSRARSLACRRIGVMLFCHFHCHSRHFLCRFHKFSPNKNLSYEVGTSTQLVGRNDFSYYLKLCACTAVIFTLKTLTDNEMGTSCIWYKRTGNVQNGPETRITCVLRRNGGEEQRIIAAILIIGSYIQQT